MGLHKVIEAVEMLKSYKVPVIKDYLADYDTLRSICPKSTISKHHQIQKAMETLAQHTGKAGIVVYVVRRGEYTACIPELGYLAKLSLPVYPVVELEYKPGLEKILADSLNKLWRIRVSADVIALQLGLMPEPLSELRQAEARRKDAAAQNVGEIDDKPLYGENSQRDERNEGKRADYATLDDKDKLIVKRDLEIMMSKLLEVNDVRDVVDFAYNVVENPRIVKAIANVEPNVLMELVELYNKMRELGIAQALLDILVDETALLAIMERLYPKIYERCLRAW